MSRFVVDASVLVKTVVDESGTPEALELLREHTIVAPDLVLHECANVLWKKVRLGEFTPEEARLAAQLLQRADIELVASRPLIGAVVDLALSLDHPAYDCAYLALAHAEGTTLITADQRLLAKLAGADEESASLARALVP